MIKAIMIGAGQRGYEVYGVYAEHHGEKLKFVAVAEPNKERRERFAQAHDIPVEKCFESWEDILKEEKMAECAFLCTQDRMHTEPILIAMEKGYHIIAEKPMAPTKEECLILEQCAEKYERALNVCHVLRYSKFFTTVKSIVDSGKLGEIVNIKHAENVSYWHQAHSFVRGNWRNSDETTPMVLQKTCHDMDIILWIIDKHCTKVSSFGSLYEFKKDKMPDGAPLRCTDGCLQEDTCLYNAKRFYLGENISWPVSVISEDTSYEGRLEALKTGPYGRCVYQCDNNVVDHQVTNLEFEGGTNVSLTMSAFTNDCTRVIEIMGTKGYLVGEMNKFGEKSNRNEVFVTDFLTGKTEVTYVEDHGIMTGHEGADVLMTDSFIEQLEKNDLNGLTSAKRSIESHLMSLAAEKSRIESRVVNMDEMWRRE